MMSDPYWEGYEAYTEANGHTPEPCENPYPPDSAEAEEWERGAKDAMHDN